jgi:hypothetical protein
MFDSGRVKRIGHTALPLGNWLSVAQSEHILALRAHPKSSSKSDELLAAFDAEARKRLYCKQISERQDETSESALQLNMTFKIASRAAQCSGRSHVEPLAPQRFVFVEGYGIRSAFNEVGDATIGARCFSQHVTARQGWRLFGLAFVIDRSLSETRDQLTRIRRPRHGYIRTSFFGKPVPTPDHVGGMPFRDRRP